MEILSRIGAVLFVFLWIFSILLNIFHPKFYWECFIPMLHKKEEKNPVITTAIIMFFVIVMLYGIMSSILIR